MPKYHIRTQNSTTGTAIGVQGIWISDTGVAPDVKGSCDYIKFSHTILAISFQPKNVRWNIGTYKIQATPKGQQQIGVHHLATTQAAQWIMSESSASDPFGDSNWIVLSFWRYVWKNLLEAKQTGSPPWGECDFVHIKQKILGTQKRNHKQSI